MTTNTTQAQLQEWWDEVNFDGKDNFALNADGSIILTPADKYSKERPVATISNPDDADIVLNALINKFTEVQARVEEVRNEWQNAQDKSKLHGKVERLKHYLQHTNAAGDFNTLFKEVSSWENELNELNKAHYAAKLKIVEAAEESAKNENFKETTQQFKDLTEEWKNCGYVEKDKNDELWSRFETAKNSFFERKREYHDEQEKEMLANLDLKLEIVDKAESLAASDKWKQATEAFKNLMDEWKAVGRTAHDKNEELWQRFIIAKNAFFDRKKQHFDTIQQEQEENLKRKEELVAKAHELKTQTNWQETTQAFADLMAEWKKIGRVPSEQSDDVWSRLNEARDHFFQNKKQNFESYKLTLEDNYAQKVALLKRAQSLKKSTRWREATTEMNELMTEWKTIGPVPREHSDKIWEEFIAARKDFFARKDADREKRKEYAEKHFSRRVQQTKSFLTKLEEEYREEEDKLQDFREALQNNTGGPKAEELSEHLNKLIAQTEQKLEHKKDKIDSVRIQLEELETKESKNENSNNE